MIKNCLKKPQQRNINLADNVLGWNELDLLFLHPTYLTKKCSGRFLQEWNEENLNQLKLETLFFPDSEKIIFTIKGTRQCKNDIEFRLRCVPQGFCFFPKQKETFYRLNCEAFEPRLKICIATYFYFFPEKSQVTIYFFHNWKWRHKIADRNNYLEIIANLEYFFKQKYVYDYKNIDYVFKNIQIEKDDLSLETQKAIDQFMIEKKHLAEETQKFIVHQRHLTEEFHKNEPILSRDYATVEINLGDTALEFTKEPHLTHTNLDLKNLLQMINDRYHLNLQPIDFQVCDNLGQWRCIGEHYV